MAPDRGPKRISRRKFIAAASGLVGWAGIVSALQGCAPPAPTSAPPTAQPAAQPAAPQPTTAPAPAAASQPTAAPAGSPVPGGVLRTTLGAEPTTLDPHKRNTVFDQDVHAAMFDGLVDDDTLDGLRGALAETWESPDAKKWTFHLRKGLKFHDGSDVTTDAVKFTMDRVMDSATAASGNIKPLVAQIATTTVVDPTTITFDLKVPNAAFPLDIGDVKILPKNFDPTKPVGTGPFQFVEWIRDRHVRVKKFPNYFRQGQPYLDEVYFLPTPDENQKIVLLQTGQVDFADTVPLPRVKELQGGGKVNVITIPAGVSPSSYFMLAKCDKPPLDNVKVRQAINYAIDRKSQLEVTFGVGTIKSNMIPPKHWAFNPQALSFNDRNVAKAKQLMAEAGYPNGFSIQLKHFTSRAEYSPMAQLFQANMAEIGIKVEIVAMEIGVWVEQVLNKADYQLGLTGVIPAYDPNSMMRTQYDIATPNGKAMGWKDDEFLKLLDQGQAVADQEQRKKIYARAQEIVQAASPAFVMNERPILFGSTPAVQGFRPDSRQIVRFGSVWLKK